MAKYSFQDIRTSRRRTTAIKKTNRPVDTQETQDEIQDEIAVKQKARDKWSSITPRKNNPQVIQNDTIPEQGEYSRFGVWFVAFIALIALLVAVGGLFTGATVTITPKQENSIVNGEFTSIKSSMGVGLTHDVMILTDEESIEVSVTQEREVNRKASGIIVVYNKHSSANQRLVKNTRFETPDGKIYRIKTSIIIPGTKVKNGEIIPGSVETKVYADEPGEEYNIGLSDFTIPGFKNEPRFKTFFARSKTEISNGFSGIVKYPSDEELNNAKSELKNILTERLVTQAIAQKPDNFILYDDAIFIEFDNLDDVFETRDDTITIKQRATLHGVIFKTAEFSKFIASQALASFDDSDIRIPKIKDLKLSIKDKENTSVIGDEIDFTITGPVHVVWNIDHDALKQSLVGLPKKNFESALSGFFNIKKVTVFIRPFWKRTFPDDVKNIRIEETITE